jgi:hypothetical protein
MAGLKERSSSRDGAYSPVETFGTVIFVAGKSPKPWRLRDAGSLQEYEWER